jgi:hypothetical protein
MRDVGPGGRSSGTAGLPGSWPSLASVYFLAASAHDWTVSHRPSHSTANTLHAGFASLDRCGDTQPKDQPTDDLPHPSKPFTMISTSMVRSSKFFGLDELKVRFLRPGGRGARLHGKPVDFATVASISKGFNRRHGHKTQLSLEISARRLRSRQEGWEQVLL